MRVQCKIYKNISEIKYYNHVNIGATYVMSYLYNDVSTLYII